MEAGEGREIGGGAGAVRRIGYLFEHPTVSGAEGSALDLLKHLDRRDVAPIAFAPEAGKLASRLREIGIPHRPWRAPRGPAEEARLIDELKRERFDVLHGNTIQLGRITGRIAGACGAAGVAHIRAFGTLSDRARSNLDGNAVLIAVSRAVRAHLIEEGIPPEKIRVIYNGFSIPPGEGSLDIRKETGMPNECPLVVWIGQITVRKAPEVFLEVARRCIAGNTDVRFLMLGDVFGMKEENLALKHAILEMMRAPPLLHRFHFLGWRRDAFAILRQSTILLHTARQEPLSRVLIEALAAETPIIATDVGGTPEVAGGCGVLVPPGDAGAMADAVNALLADPEKRALMRREGSERWRTLFQADRMAREVAAVWREV